MNAAYLLKAYRRGIFPWPSSAHSAPTWYCPDPRMVLWCSEFRTSNSLRKTLSNAASNSDWQVRCNTAFSKVIHACAAQARAGQDGTWISAEIIQAYEQLHEWGYAHSFEAWYQNQLVGGGYGVAIGRMFYGESMFALQPNASKIALASWVALLAQQGFPLVDCQQNTPHLASLGGREIARAEFLRHIRQLTAQAGLNHWPTDLKIQQP